MNERSAVSEAEWATWRGLSAMHHHLERAVTTRLRTCEAAVSGSEFDVLAALYAADGELRARDLAADLGWEKSRLSHLLSRMQGRGLVDRNVGLLDRPGTWITLTADGRTALETAAPERIAALRALFFDHLTVAERDVLRGVAEKVLAAMGRDGDLDD